MRWVTSYPLVIPKPLTSEIDDAEDQKDVLGADSSMQYLNSIGVDLEGASLFLAMELVQAPTIGEITRDGFVKGWNNPG